MNKTEQINELKFLVLALSDGLRTIRFENDERDRYNTYIRCMSLITKTAEKLAA